MAKSGTSERKIVLGVDASKHSERAFDCEAELGTEKLETELAWDMQSVPRRDRGKRAVLRPGGTRMKVEESSNSLISQGYIKNLCNKERDNLLVIHAHECPSISVPHAHGSAYFEDIQFLVEKSTKQARELLENFGRKCKQHGVSFKLCKETSNNPGEVICKLAKDERAQFVVMGSRGVGTLGRTFLGSVSHYCVHHTHVPLAVVPPPQ